MVVRVDFSVVPGVRVPVYCFVVFQAVSTLQNMTPEQDFKYFFLPLSVSFQRYIIHIHSSMMLYNVSNNTLSKYYRDSILSDNCH